MPEFELPAEFTIYSAQVCYDALLRCLDQSQYSEGDTNVLLVHAANVVQVDAAGLQILIALAKTQRPWQLVQPSAALQQACQDYGLHECLQQLSAPETAGEST